MNTLIRAALAAMFTLGAIAVAASPAIASPGAALVSSPKTYPLSLNITPYEVDYTGPGTQTVTVKDSGTLALHFTARVEQFAGKGCQLAPPPPAFVAVSPAHFTLQPGQRQVTRITVHPPRGTAGTFHLLAVYSGAGSARNAAGTGGAVSAAIGARVTVDLGGAPVGAKPCAAPKQPHHAVAASPAASTGFPTMTVGLIVAALAALLGAGLALRTRRQHGTHGR